jgi:uncharacterized protein HemX
MSSIIAIVSAAIAVLIGMLGIEKHKNRKKDEVITKQKVEIEKEKKQAEVFKEKVQSQVKNDEEFKEIEKEEEKVEENIKEAETDEEVIEIANDIVSGFNSK